MTGQEPPVFAVATAPGGAIAIIRLTGEGSLALARSLYLSKKGKPRKHFRHAQMYHGFLVDPETDESLDEILLVCFSKGKSYTAEELMEIHCHGSIAVVEKIVELLTKLGASPAKPGEFTRRAFLNGRIGLSQAEAVRDLIASETFLESSIAIHNLKGDLKSKIASLRDELLNCAAHLEVNLDYPEEDIEDLTIRKISTRIKAIISLIDKILKSYERMVIFREGIYVAIIGEPNAGKSSLLNTLLKEDRAIVTDIPGTTRDHIEESLRFKGTKFRIVDTAGLRESHDPVEKIGIERSKIVEEKAKICIYIYDASEPVTLRQTEKTCLHVLNKCDLEMHAMNKQLIKERNVVVISALEGIGINRLLEELYELSRVFIGEIDPEIPMLTSTRQAENLRNSRESLNQFQTSLKTGIPVDICMVELYEAISYLGEITGVVVTEDILDRIFSTFCIGK